MVISVDDYAAMRPLRNAVNDGRAVREALEALEFDVTPSFDDDLATLRRKLRRFREDAEGADVALVFFSGHGMEIAGENRLLPADADGESLSRLRETSLPLEEVRDLVADVGKVALVLLDACRNDPFGAASDPEGRGGRVLVSEITEAVRPGLRRAPGRIGKAGAVLFGFSASPGEVASDGAGDNSAFSAALAKHLPTDGLDIRSVLTLVRQEVYERSGGTQLPYVEDGLLGVFFAARTGTLPERERLLLAMAGISDTVRSDIEGIAAGRAVPLAPLYAALIAGGLDRLSQDERGAKLIEAAQTYEETRQRLRTLSAGDPAVARIRAEAEQRLSLGAFEDARRKLAEAAAVDADAGETLARSLVARRLSQAQTLGLDANVALLQTDYPGSIAAMEKAASLYALTEHEDLPATARADRNRLLSELGDLYAALDADPGRAIDAYERMRTAAQLRLTLTPASREAELDVAIASEKLASLWLRHGDRAKALGAYEASLGIVSKLASANDGDTEWQSELGYMANRIGGDQTHFDGDPDLARRAYGTALTVATALAQREPDRVEWQQGVMALHGALYLAGDRRRSHITDALAIAVRLAAEGRLEQPWRGAPDRLREMLEEHDAQAR